MDRGQLGRGVIQKDMKTAKELYPNANTYSWFSVGDYQPMINEIGNVLIQVDDCEYQGDTRVLYEKDGKYGYLIFGWGSCSGCDALLDCGNYGEVQKLFNGLKKDVKWFDTLMELQEHFKSRDWEGDYCWHCNETKEFIDKVLNYKL